MAYRFLEFSLFDVQQSQVVVRGYGFRFDAYRFRVMKDRLRFSLLILQEQGQVVMRFSVARI